MSWSSLPEKDSFDSELEKLSEPLPPAPMMHDPGTQIELVDLAAAEENRKTYLGQGEKKKFEQRKEEGFSTSPPLNIYEPGFRDDLHDALITHFKKLKRERENNQRLREKMGMRSY